MVNRHSCYYRAAIAGLLIRVMAEHSIMSGFIRSEGG